MTEFVLGLPRKRIAVREMEWPGDQERRHGQPLTEAGRQLINRLWSDRKDVRRKGGRKDGDGTEGLMGNARPRECEYGERGVGRKMRGKGDAATTGLTAEMGGR